MIAWLRVYPDYTLETWYSDTAGIHHLSWIQKFSAEKKFQNLKKSRINIFRKKNNIEKFTFIRI